MVGTKVFVGNLNFKTTEADLATAFSVAGKVVKVNIITRGPRSLGYGFVEFENDAVAEASVKALDKKEIDGRPINVEVARPKQEKPAAPSAPVQGGEQPLQQRERRPRRPRAPRKAPTNGAPASTSTAPAPRSNNNNNAAPAPTGAVGKQEVADKPRRRRVRKPRTDIPAPTNNNNNNAAPATTTTKPVRPPRTVPENRLPSDTTIFVANLAWSVENNTFAAFLTSEGIKFKNAYVVKRRNGSSRGYGFIEFDTAADQKVALEKLDKKQFEGRELAVKVALAQPAKPAETAAAPSSTN